MRKGATMNRDEGQYFLSHVYDEPLLEKSTKRRKPGNTKTTGNFETPDTGSSASVGIATSSCVEKGDRRPR